MDSTSSPVSGPAGINAVSCPAGIGANSFPLGIETVSNSGIYTNSFPPHTDDSDSNLHLKADSFPPSIGAHSFPPDIDIDFTYGIDADSSPPDIDANSTCGIKANSLLDYSSTSVPAEFAYLPSSSKKIVLKSILSANISYPLLYQVASLHY